MSADPWRVQVRENWPTPVCRTNSDVSVSNNRARPAWAGSGAKRRRVTHRKRSAEQLAPRGEELCSGMSHDRASGALTARNRGGTAFAYSTAGGAFLWPQTDRLRGFHQLLRNFSWRQPMILGVWTWAGRPGGISDISHTPYGKAPIARRPLKRTSWRRSLRAALRHSRCRRVR